MRRGKVKLTEEVDILGYQYAPFRTKVLSMDCFERFMNNAEAGESIMMFFRGTTQSNLYRGHFVCAPGSMKCNKKFVGKTYVLIPEEGGRDKGFNERFKPQVSMKLK